MSLRSRMKLPKEHGAWAMFYVPLVMGVLVARSLSARVLLFVLSATFFFVSRESILIWWRAHRLRRDPGEARQMVLVYLGLAALFGMPLIFVYQLLWLIPLASFALLIVGINAEQSVRRRDRTIGGEVLAIIGMTLSGAASHYVARGVWEVTAFWLWGLNALYFASSVFYVKLRVHAAPRQKQEAQRRSWRQCALYHCVLLALLVILSIRGSLSPLVLVAFVPALIRTFWHLLNPPAKLSLRRIGVLEIIYSVVYTILLTITFRPV